jgi:hypothetical protein
LLVLPATLLAATLLAADGVPEPSQGDLGGVGLWDTPTARMLPDGHAAVGLAVAGGLYRHSGLDVQVLPWLETTLHETVRPAQGGLDTTLDAGIGAKIRLLTEQRWRPALAVGVRDMAGGRFAAEYLVLNKGWNGFDVSLGLGWGRLGESGGLGTPLGWLGGRYDRPRQPVTGPAGPESWFTGEVAPFVGVAWQTPIPELVVKAELTPDRRRVDRWENPKLSAGVPINAGLVWRPLPWLELAAAFERGQDALLRAAVISDAGALVLPRPPPSALPEPTASVVVDGTRAIAWVDPGRDAADAYPPAQVAGRALRAMARHVPPGVEELTVVTGSRGLDGVAVSVLAHDLRRPGEGPASPPELRQSARLEPGGTVSALAALAGDWRPSQGSPWQFAVNPRFEQSPFESTQPMVYRASVGFDSVYQFPFGLSAGHSARATLGHNLDALDTALVRGALVRGALAPASNRLIRSDLADYVWAAPVNLVERAWLGWLAQPAPDWTTRLSLGWFEEMYAGVGGEVLYRPWRSRWAVGAEIDGVRKRVPGNTLALWQDSDTVTAQASLYYDSADGRVEVALHGGRYLGGDCGATLELTRHFDSGIRLGVWFTATDGADRLGLRLPQGRDHFDGGLRLSLPLGVLSGLPAASRAELAIRPLGRDSGQRLDLPLRLEPLTRSSGYGALSGGWARLTD